MLLVCLAQVALFLTAPGTLDPSLALGLYVKCGTSDWLYRGCVHNGHPSEVMPLQVCRHETACKTMLHTAHQRAALGTTSCPPVQLQWESMPAPAVAGLVCQMGADQHSGLLHHQDRVTSSWH